MLDPPPGRRRRAGRGGGRFATTVHVLLSAVLKLMRVVRIPPGTRLYRGLGGRLALPASFGTADANGLHGYAEWGFLSTTASRDVAVQARGPLPARGPPSFVRACDGVSLVCAPSTQCALCETASLRAPVRAQHSGAEITPPWNVRGRLGVRRGGGRAVLGGGPERAAADAPVDAGGGHRPRGVHQGLEPVPRRGGAPAGFHCGWVGGWVGGSVGVVGVY